MSHALDPREPEDDWLELFVLLAIIYLISHPFLNNTY